MKHTILFFAWMSLAFVLQGQITVNDSTFPTAGDTLKTNFSAAPNIDIQAPGVDLSWDLSSIQIGVPQEVIYKDASEGNNTASFPSADLVSDFGPQGAGEAYYTSSASEFKFLGYAGEDPLGFGISIIAVFDPAQLDRHAPMNFLDVQSSSASLLLAFSSEVIPSAILDSLPFTPDSIRLRLNIDRLDVVDAWGSLTLPGNQSYEVLRQKRTDEQDVRVDIKIELGPASFWQDVTDVIIALGFPGFGQLGTSTSISYRFFNDAYKEPVAIINTDSMENPTTVVYRRGEITVDNQEVIAQSPEITAFPNPAPSSVTFQTKHLPAGEYTLRIFNILGKTLSSQKHYLEGNQQIPFDLDAYAKGTYIYQLSNDQGAIINTRRLVVLKP